jgi:hypothetical protein
MERNPEEGVPSKRSGAHSHLQTGGRYRRWVEKFQEKSSWPSDPKDIRESFLLGQWEVSSKWLNVDVYFSLGLGGKFPVSHLQKGGSPVLTWFPFVHPNRDIYIYIIKSAMFEPTV